MSDELVQVNGERFAFAEAVGRVADALHPLGPAAKMMAEACALRIELKRLSQADKQLEANRLENLARLAERRSDVDASFDLIRQKAAASRDFANEINASMRDVRRRLLSPRTPMAEKQMYAQLIPDLAREFNNHTEVDGDDTTERIDTILNGRGSSGPAGRRRGRR